MFHQVFKTSDLVALWDQMFVDQPVYFTFHEEFR